MSSLQPKEKTVAEAILCQPANAVEMTAQQLADHVGVSRASVIRTAQSLGYAGFPQLRVALVQEQAAGSSPLSVATQTNPTATSVADYVAQFAERLSASFGALDEGAIQRTIELLDNAERVLVVANGFSAPLGLDFAQRLVSAGRHAEWHTDSTTQRIAAHHLGEKSVCFVFSGSGSSQATLYAARQASDSGATVIAATSFSPSPLTEVADVVLLVPPVNPSFQDELIHTSRAALMLLNEQLVQLLLNHRGERGDEARRASLTMIGDALES